TFNTAAGPRPCRLPRWARARVAPRPRMPTGGLRQLQLEVGQPQSSTAFVLLALLGGRSAHLVHDTFVVHAIEREQQRRWACGEIAFEPVEGDAICGIRNSAARMTTAVFPTRAHRHDPNIGSMQRSWCRVRRWPTWNPVLHDPVWNGIVR